jgi:hypothetical protein
VYVCYYTTILHNFSTKKGEGAHRTWIRHCSQSERSSRTRSPQAVVERSPPAQRVRLGRAPNVPGAERVPHRSPVNVCDPTGTFRQAPFRTFRHCSNAVRTECSCSGTTNFVRTPLFNHVESFHLGTAF